MHNKVQGIRSENKRMSKVLNNLDDKDNIDAVIRLLIRLERDIPYIYDKTLEKYNDETLKRKKFKQFLE